MNAAAFLKWELLSLLLVSHVLAFCTGLFLPMINFEVLGFFQRLPFIYWVPILIGSLFFGLGVRDALVRVGTLAKRLQDMPHADSDR